MGRSEPLPEVISLTEAAVRLGITMKTAYKAARRGDIPSFRIGGKWLVPRIPFEELLRGEFGQGSPSRAEARDR